MKLPISWLKEYVEFDDTIEGLADKLTFSGTEVEGIITVGSDYEGVVVGEVLSVDKHPNADRLSVCQVSDGSETYQVVCGAPNVEAGGKYPFAMLGAELKGGFKIKKAKIRGVESFGMLCAEDELGISEDHDGVLLLDATLKTGIPLAEVMGPPETVFELEVTPNRPDCLSIIGMARELAALYGTTLKRPDVHFDEMSEPANTLTAVEILDPEKCPRYTARILKNVKIGPSPAWMQKRLDLVGIRPINNVVDITNYVLMECGHPLHAFDQSLLKEGRIVVRSAEPGEKIETLDNVVRELDPEMLVIADAERSVAVAGVMGGAGSEICENTSTVLLESAYFEPDSVRDTSRRLALSSESSYRFERGTDVGGVDWASRRAVSLMQQLASADVAADVVDVYPHPETEREIECRVERVNTLIGVAVTSKDIVACFEALGLPIVKSDDESCVVFVPSFRRDLEREVDLIEEFARWYGLDRIPEPAPLSRVIPEADDSHVRAVYACQDNLCALGLSEIQNYSLVAPRLLDLFDKDNTAEREVLPNPISMDQSVLRTSLIPQMVETLGNNRSRQIYEAALFESGRTFQCRGEGRPKECDRISIGLFGPVGRNSFEKKKPVTPEEMFTWLKGIVEGLLSAQKAGTWSVEPAEVPYLEAPYSVSVLLGGKKIGVLGLVSKAVREEWRFNEPVGVAELETDALIEHLFDVREIVAPGVYPPIERDMALLVDSSIRHDDIVKVIQQSAPKELEKIELFDIYEGESLGANRKSMAYSLTYRSWDKTLTDQEANGYHDGVKEMLRKKLSIEVRES